MSNLLKCKIIQIYLFRVKSPLDPEVRTCSVNFLDQSREKKIFFSRL